MERQPRPDQPTAQPAARARDRALSWVRRTTTAVGIAAVVGTAGLGVVVASEASVHTTPVSGQMANTATSGATGATTTPTTSAASGSGSSSSDSSSATTTPAGKTKKPTTVSGQS